MACAQEQEPFHAGSGVAATSRRLILVSWEFPPRDTAGSLRWEKFSHFLHHAGYGLDVITAPPLRLDAATRSRLAGLPSSIRLFAVPERPGTLTRMEDRLSSLLRRHRSGSSGSVASPSPQRERPVPTGRPDSVPAEDIRWIPRGLRDLMRMYWVAADFQQSTGWGRDAGALARDILTDQTVAIITSGPPHGAHFAGLHVGRATGLPHILDYRDPWSLRRRMNEVSATPLAFLLARRAERRLLRHAALVTTTTDAIRSGMERLHKQPRPPMLTVLNGYDDEPVPDAVPDVFRVMYAGAIYLDRDPRVLFAGAALAIRETGATPEQFRIQLIGNVETFNGLPVRDLAAAAGIDAHLDLRGRVPRAELLCELARASVLVSLPQDSPWAIPSKIFEHMAYPASMLVYATAGTPTADLLVGTEIDVLEPSDVLGTSKALVRHYREFRAGRRPRPYAAGPGFSREHQAARLIERLGKLVPRRVS